MIIVFLITIFINLIISILINTHTINALLELFKQEDEIDKELIKHVTNIYSIINYNGLIMKKEKNEKQ